MASKKPEAKPAEKAPESTAVTTPAIATPSGIAGFKIAKRVTMPTLNLKVNEPKILRIDDAFRVSTYKDPDPAKAKEKPATICTATDMQTGEVALLLVPEVMHKNLTEQYPNDTYVGKIFGLQKLPKRPGKRYFDFEIAELVAE